MNNWWVVWTQHHFLSFKFPTEFLAYLRDLLMIRRAQTVIWSILIARLLNHMSHFFLLFQLNSLVKFIPIILKIWKNFILIRMVIFLRRFCLLRLNKRFILTTMIWVFNFLFIDGFVFFFILTIIDILSTPELWWVSFYLHHKCFCFFEVIFGATRF